MVGNLDQGLLSGELVALHVGLLARKQRKKHADGVAAALCYLFFYFFVTSFDGSRETRTNILCVKKGRFGHSAKSCQYT